MTQSQKEAAILALLEQVKDPEVPALTLLDLGVIRRVVVQGESVSIAITPTYSGCPALEVMTNDIRKVLTANGYPQVVIDIVYSPAWTTEWISENGKKKLKEFGIAPPGAVEQEPLVSIGSHSNVVPCPFCDSPATHKTSQFGATACKALYFCDGCKQPFEYFKPF